MGPEAGKLGRSKGLCYEQYSHTAQGDKPGHSKSCAVRNTDRRRVRITKDPFAP